MSRCGTRFVDDGFKPDPLLAQFGRDPRGDVPLCRAHTRSDANPEKPPIRLSPCTRLCWIARDADAAPQPVTHFLIHLTKMTDKALLASKPAGAVKKFPGLRHDWAASYIALEKQQRGLSA